MRVLLIDDDALLRQTIRKMLESAGHEVVDEAENGRVGLDAFRKQAIDAVVTDIIMPQKEGIETIRDIRALNPAVRIVAISGGGRTHKMDFLNIAAKLGATATPVEAVPQGSAARLCRGPRAAGRRRRLVMTRAICR